MFVMSQENLCILNKIILIQILYNLYRENPDILCETNWYNLFLYYYLLEIFFMGTDVSRSSFSTSPNLLHTLFAHMAHLFFSTLNQARVHHIRLCWYTSEKRRGLINFSTGSIPNNKSEGELPSIASGLRQPIYSGCPQSTQLSEWLNHFTLLNLSIFVKCISRGKKQHQWQIGEIELASSD